MRPVFALLLLPAVAVACTPDIPVRGDFGASALVPSGDTAPEFARFNAYDPGAGRLIADQLCATPYIPLEEKSLGGAPGQIVQSRGRCQVHKPILGNDGDFTPDFSP